MDLMLWISKHKNLFESQSVLELGCGSALPSLAAALCGANPIYVVDFNEDVRPLRLLDACL